MKYFQQAHLPEIFTESLKSDGLPASPHKHILHHSLFLSLIVAHSFDSERGESFSLSLRISIVIEFNLRARAAGTWINWAVRRSPIACNCTQWVALDPGRKELVLFLLNFDFQLFEFRLPPIDYFYREILNFAWFVCFFRDSSMSLPLYQYLMFINLGFPFSWIDLY